MKKLIVLLYLFLSVTILFAQNTVTVTGKVTDANNQTVPGVSVQIKGTTQGAITDLDGNYTVTAPPDATLVFSFIGLATQEIAVNNRTTINVQMREQSFNVDEVVVVGYGTQKVKDLTSAISTVKADEIAKSPSGQVMQSLQGKVAGMQIVSGGAPGGGPTVRIRGVGSYPGSSSEAPLYVVDGQQYDNIGFLNPSDINTISILKDASAAAIYGVKAANGVVLIETKSGAYNQKARVTYDGYYGVQVAQNVLQMANAEQFTTMAMESGSVPDITNIANAMARFGRSRLNPMVPNVNTDWYKEIIRQAPIQNHSVTISGGSEKAAYSVGSSYFGQDGILDMKNDYQRFNIQSKVDIKATDWATVGGNFILSNSLGHGAQNDAWSQAYWAVPILPVYDELNTTASPTNYASAQLFGYRGGQNPMPTLEFNENQSKIKEIHSNIFVQIDFIPTKLNLRSTYSHYFGTANIRDLNFPFFISADLKTTNAGITRRNETQSRQLWDNVLTYNNEFGNHSLTLMGGTSFRYDYADMLTAKGLDFPWQNEESWYIAQSDRSKLPIDAVNDDGFREYGMSYFGRIAYNYSDRYLLYGTMRADGTSKYQEKFGYFPSVGAGWVLSEEGFMDESNAFDFLKLRLSWGQLGNSKIPASEGARTSTVLTTAFNDILYSGYITSDNFSYLKWELTEETNIGVTARMIDNKLSLDADYYIRDTKNAVIPVNNLFVGGSVRRNVGEIRNTGFEVVLNWTDQISENLSYNIGGNVSFIKNEVRDLGGQPYLNGGQAEFLQRSIVGDPILAFYGYEVAGVYQNEDEIAKDKIAVANGLVPGDFKYVNQNGDTLINDQDRVVLGSYLPTLIYGVNLGITYGNLEFSANIMGQDGNKILNRKRGEIIWTPDLNMDADLAKNRWHGEGTSNKYPSSAGLRKGWNQKMSTYFVEDGGFFRIQNIQLAYNIKGKTLIGEKFPDARITLTAERPLTVFKYNGFNPEVPDGIDRQTYPVPGVYTVGLNINF